MASSAHHNIVSCLRPMAGDCLREIFGVGNPRDVILTMSKCVGVALDISDLQLHSGNLLFVRTNGAKENAGRCSMFESDIEDGCFASYPIRVRLDPRTLNPSLLNECSRTEIGTSCLIGKAIRTADGKFNINSGTLKAVLVPVPGIDEQEGITNALSLIDTQSQSSSALAKRSARQDIFRSLLVKLETAMEETEGGHSFPLASGKGGQACAPSAKPAPLKLFGQEYVPENWAMANMNMIIHDMEGRLEIGDTFKNPKFRDKRGKCRTFGRVVATAQRYSPSKQAKSDCSAACREDNPLWNRDWFTETDSGSSGRTIAK